MSIKSENKKQSKTERPILDEDVSKVLSCINKHCSDDDFIKLLCFFHKHLDEIHFTEWMTTDNAHNYIRDNIAFKTRTKWDGLKYDKSTINITTLHEMAKAHNEDQYIKTFSKTYRLIVSVLTDFKVAELIHHLYKKEFVFLNTNKNPTWYHFENHRWIKDENNLTLSKYIASDIVGLYEKKKQRYSNVKIHEFFNKFIQKLQMNKNKTTFIKESQILFNTNIKWKESLDANRDLIGFENGIYDLKNNVFRDGKPEDMIEKTTGYNYTPDINKKIKQQILKFFSECLPEESKEFLLKLSAYCISGNRYLEWVIFLIGVGGNGKGAYKTLMSKTLGQYAYEPSVSMLVTTAKSSSNATPEKAKAKGARFMITEEPEDDNSTTLKVGYLKELSGGNKIQARELHQDPIEFLPQFQLFLMMNNPIKLNTYDGGIERRLKNIEFPYKFVNNPKLPHEKKIDLNLKNNFENNTEYYQQFFLILIDYYYKYINGSKSIDTPECVEKFTKEYIGESNIVKQFLMDNYEITNNPSDKVKYSDVYNAFKIENKNIDKTKFSNQLKINGFKKTGDTSYKGVRGIFIEGIKEQYDDDDIEAIPIQTPNIISIF